MTRYSQTVTRATFIEIFQGNTVFNIEQGDPAQICMADFKHLNGPQTRTWHRLEL